LKKNTSIKVKAAFLFAVFALNTLVGFACSVGMDMGFNSQHHAHSKTQESVMHVHSDGKKHDHQDTKKHRSTDTSAHKHSDTHHNGTSTGEKDCCSDEVKQFHDLDKSIPSSKLLVDPIFFSSFVTTYYRFDLLLRTNAVKDVKRFVRQYHPPIADIRISIQSFQV
jgi:hypothetical protein